MFLEILKTIISLEFLPVLLIFLVLTGIFYSKQPILKVSIFWLWILFLNLVLGFLMYFSANFNAPSLIITTTGYSALFLIMLALIAGPSARVSKLKFFKILFKNRRNIGVAGFLLSLIHYLSNWAFLFSWDYSRVEKLVEITDSFGQGIYAGLLAFFIFLLAAIVSNKKSQKKLGMKIWKWIQLASYPALLLVILHIFLIGRVLQNSVFLTIIFQSLFVFTIAIKIVDIYLQKTKKNRT